MFKPLFLLFQTASRTIRPWACRKGCVCNQDILGSQGEFLSLATKKFLTKTVPPPHIAWCLPTTSSVLLLFASEQGGQSEISITNEIISLKYTSRALGEGQGLSVQCIRPFRVLLHFLPCPCPWRATPIGRKMNSWAPVYSPNPTTIEPKLTLSLTSSFQDQRLLCFRLP